MESVIGMPRRRARTRATEEFDGLVVGLFVAAKPFLREEHAQERRQKPVPPRFPHARGEPGDRASRGVEIFRGIHETRDEQGALEEVRLAARRPARASGAEAPGPPPPSVLPARDRDAVPQRDDDAYGIPGAQRASG